MYVIIARALVSWVNPDPWNPIVQFLERATEPVLYPIRRRFGWAMGIDLSPIVATLMNTLVTTQALADELKHAAHRDAELIMKEAELKAGELLREAQAELAGTQRDLSDLRKQKLMAIERLRSTLRTFERMLEIEEGDEQLPAPGDRPEKIADGSNR